MSYMNNGGGFVLASDLRPSDTVRFDGSDQPLTVLEVRHEATSDRTGYTTTVDLRLGGDTFEVELDPYETLRIVPAKEARLAEVEAILERRTGHAH